MDLVAFTKAQFKALDDLLTYILQTLNGSATQPITNSEIDQIIGGSK